jgi:hypothetical protein
VALPLEVGADHLDDVRFVVDDEDPSHRWEHR